MNVNTILDGLALAVSFVLIACAFISKTIVWRPPIHSNPTKTAWFGRIFMFCVGLVGVLEFGGAIFKWNHTLVNLEQ